VGTTEYKLGQLNGRKVVTWWEGNRRRRYRFRAGITQAELNTELNRFIKSREKLLGREPKTVGEIFDAYIRDREIDGKPTGKHTVSWKALRPYFAHMSPSDIDKKACRDFQDARTRAGRSLGTSWTDLSVLRACLNWAGKSNVIQVAPFIWLPTPPKPKERHLTRDEAEQLLANAQAMHLRMFIRLALATAGRASAILELEWPRVDFQRGQIDLRTAEQNRIKRRAIVPMNDTLRAALLEAQAGALTGYVIEWGGQRVRSVKRAFAQACKRAGLTDVSPHTLRHTAAVWMAEAGESMAVIAQYLGHSDSRITERVYARFSPDYLKRASQALDMRDTRSVDRGSLGVR
jgi:integrase